MCPLDKVVTVAVVTLTYTNCGVPKTVMTKMTVIMTSSMTMTMIALYLPSERTSQIRIEDQVDARNRRATIALQETRNPIKATCFDS